MIFKLDMENYIMGRVITGIKGFDKLVDGGFPLGSIVLLSGQPGTGKTIFGLNYLFNGAKKFNERGVFITLEEDRNSLLEQAKQFGWDLAKLERDGLLQLITIRTFELKKGYMEQLFSKVEKFGAKRLVIDSLSSLSIKIPTAYMKLNEVNDFAIRRFIYEFTDKLKDINGITTLLTQQSSENLVDKSDLAEFMCDGVIKISFEPMGGKYSRSLIVKKMRRTRNEEDIHPLEISKDGIVIHDIK
ncbi:AAA family ATPase [Candidatus Woesearchaeota archaeon]|nr:AAA family ATPase [Candidatus Woesearchaeota archaeon]